MDTLPLGIKVRNLKIDFNTSGSQCHTLGLLTSKSAYFLSPWLLIFEMSGIFFLTLNDINIDLRSYARVIVFCFEAPSGVHFLNF